jgi:hypothetical protein
VTDVTKKKLAPFYFACLPALLSCRLQRTTHSTYTSLPALSQCTSRTADLTFRTAVWRGDDVVVEYGRGREEKGGGRATEGMSHTVAVSTILRTQLQSSQGWVVSQTVAGERRRRKRGQRLCLMTSSSSLTSEPSLPSPPLPEGFWSLNLLTFVVVSWRHTSSIHQTDIDSDILLVLLLLVVVLLGHEEERQQSNQSKS